MRIKGNSNEVAPGVSRVPNVAPSSIVLRMAELLGVFLLVFGATVALQYVAGAYSGDFVSDEGSHYISSTLIHDYLVSGTFSSPLTYLTLYHSHYPLVGIGHWPPLYYLVVAAWMLVLSSTFASALLLSAVVTSAVAVITYAQATTIMGRPGAILAALAFVAAPLVQSGSSAIMLDIPITLLCLASMLAYVRYLDTQKVGYSVLFGLLASATLMVKGNGAALALLPPLVVLIGRRFDLPSQWSFWIPLPIVAVLTGPWYMLTYGQIEVGFRYGFGLDYARIAIVANSHIILAAVGPIAVAAAIIGFLRVVAAPQARRAANNLIGTAALFAAVVVFQCLAPAAIQDRYLAPALPPLLILAVYGLDWIARRLAEFWRRKTSRAPDVATVRAGVLALAALSFLPSATRFESAPQLGLRMAAREIWRDRITDNPAVLVAANGAFEEAAVATLATLDPHRPSLFAIRGSRLLGGGGYNNADYLPRFQTSAEVMAEIDRYAIPYVLLQSSGSSSEWAHLRQLQEASTLYPGRWQLIYRDTEHLPETRIFRITGNEVKPADAAMLVALSAPRHFGQ
jgi:hypothetical protein